MYLLTSLELIHLMLQQLLSWLQRLTHFKGVGESRALRALIALKSPLKKVNGQMSEVKKGLRHSAHLVLCHERYTNQVKTASPLGGF